MPDTPRDGDAERLADEIVREVCELPDRTSPDDQPDALMVTWQELRTIIIRELEPVLEARDAALREALAEIDRLRQALAGKAIEIQSYKSEISWRINLMKGIPSTLAAKERETIERCAEAVKHMPPCPFDGPNRLEPEDPCPVCGDRGDGSFSDPSNCRSPVIAIRALADRAPEVKS
jgi:hypothetical protein